MNTWRETRRFLLFLLFFGVFRTAVADWNPIPSGSMRPTLLEGDVVLVNRLAYDLKLPLTDVVLARLNEPRRGDIVTFSSPVDGTRLIKRLVALPGDTVAMHQGTLIINGQAAHFDSLQVALEPARADHLGAALQAVQATEHIGSSTRRIQALPALTARRDFGPLTLAADTYFMLGDNRDNSADSRYLGPIPRAVLIGRAHHLLASADMLGTWMPRWERFGQRLR
jgi:signal peptidase I